MASILWQAVCAFLVNLPSAASDIVGKYGWTNVQIFVGFNGAQFLQTVVHV